MCGTSSRTKARKKLLKLLAKRTGGTYQLAFEMAVEKHTESPFDEQVIKEGVEVLRSEPLKTAADQLKGLLRKVPRLMAMEPGKSLDKEMDVLLDVAHEVQHDADKAFNTVRTPGEKIRAVVIACAALEATAAAGSYDVASKGSAAASAQA